MKFLEFVKLIQEGSAIRSFSCLMLDCQDLYLHIAKIHEQIAPEDVFDDEPGHGYELESHVTCAYGFSETKPQDVIPKLDLVPCRYKIKGLSLFENEKFDVLKFDIQSAELNKLNKQIMDNFDITTSHKVYHAHLTIFYAKKGMGEKYLKIKSPLIGETFISNRYIFSNPNSEKVWIDV